jgi:lipopolysaccharide/colanic/teichoic acid biosynthesis glycosyltransferase
MRMMQISKVNTESSGKCSRAFQNLESPVGVTDLINRTRVNRLFSYKFWKHIFDRIFALIVMIALSPIFALIAIMIRLDSPGSALFHREQVGENGKKFTMYKFRTMRENNNDYKYKAYISSYILKDAPYTVDQNGQGVYKVIDDSRTTRFGTLLRKTNLDELPQVFNVLKGEMSFIGPRPDIPFAVSLYNDWHRQRLQVKPGITGLWQVSQRKELSFNEMVRLDIEYINRQSLFLDILIFFATIKVILKMDGS